MCDLSFISSCPFKGLDQDDDEQQVVTKLSAARNMRRILVLELANLNSKTVQLLFYKLNSIRCFISSP